MSWTGTLGAGRRAAEAGCKVVLERVEKDVAMLWERAERLSPAGRVMERGGRWEEEGAEGVG